MLSGSGIYGYYDGTGPFFSAFNNPTALACDQADNLPIWDSGNLRVRRMDLLQNVTTIAGNGGYYYSSMDGTGTNAAFNNVHLSCFRMTLAIFISSAELSFGKCSTRKLM